MPADRFFHPRAGHSLKVNGLTDFEFRVWWAYVLAADDFGVMRYSALTLQAAFDALAAKKPQQVMRSLEHVRASGLIDVFEHQGQKFAFQWDWQTWQKVEYPRATDNPKPNDAALATCDEPTRTLFLKHPGGTRKRAEGVPNVSQEKSEDNPTTRAGAPAKRLTANANGQRPTLEEGSGETELQRFIAAYPACRRKGGYLVGSAFFDARQKVALDVMLTALENHKRSEQWQDEKHIPNPEKWLAGEYWLQVKPVNGSKVAPRESARDAVMREPFYSHECPHEAPKCSNRLECASRSAKVSA